MTKPCAQERMQEIAPIMDDVIQSYHRQMEKRGLVDGSLNSAELVPVEEFSTFAEEFQRVVEHWRDGGIDIRPAIASVMILGAATEDNLPHYTAELKQGYGDFGDLSVAWVNAWTASEIQHGRILDRIIMATRMVDPVLYEQIVSKNARAGIHPQITTPEIGFAYLTVQEKATEISHKHVRDMLGDATARVIDEVATDEALHANVYRRFLKAAGELYPDEVLLAMEQQFFGFDMPGRQGIMDFTRHAKNVVAAGGLDAHKTLEMFRQTLHFVGFDALEPTSEAAKKAKEQLQLFIDTDSDAYQRARRSDELLKVRVARQVMVDDAGDPSGLRPFVDGVTVERQANGSYIPIEQ